MAAIKPHFTFWVVATAGLLWHLTGCLSFITQNNPQALKMMSEINQIIIAGRPAWATAAAAVAAFGGAVGCILILLRQRVAVPVLILSLGGSLITAFFLGRLFGPAPSVALQLLVAVALVWYASIARRSGWLR